MGVLSVRKIECAVPRDRRYALNDGAGLWLFVQPSGKKGWHVLYEGDGGKTKEVKIGQFPLMTLKQAREELVAVKHRISLGLAPGRRSNGDPTLFDAVKIWFEEWRKDKSPDTEHDVWARFENHVFPDLQNTRLCDLTPDHFEDLLIGIQADGLHSTARYVLIYCKKVFRFRPVRKLCPINPVESIKASELLNPYERKHRPRIPIGQLPRLIAKIDEYPDLVARYALQLMLLLWTRRSELLGAKWCEFDFEGGVWRIPSERMKKRREHLVPLPKQALSLLDQIKWALKSDGLIFFPDGRIDYELMLSALTDMGYGGVMCVHGFRGLASTYLNELERGERAIEAQLSHINPSASASAYNAAEYMRKRREIMQEWADYIDTLRI